MSQRSNTTELDPEAEAFNAEMEELTADHSEPIPDPEAFNAEMDELTAG